MTEAADVPVQEDIYPLGQEKDSGQQALEAWNEVQTTGTSHEYRSYDFPFAYAYAKHLTERLITHKFNKHDISNKLLIIRPSAIAPAIEFPYQGFSSPASTPSTVLAASIVLYPGRHMVIAGRCQDPWKETTMDEVPVDVVVDRLLIHTAFATSGCIHAVRGENERFPFEAWWKPLMGKRRIPWRVKPAWKEVDWHSSKSHPSARIYKVLGASFAFSQEDS